MISPAEQAQQMRLLFRIPFKAGEKANLVSTKWFEAWGKYTGFKSAAIGANPGPIDNHVLIENSQLRKCLVKHRDYEPISHDAWNALFSWYGGGPELVVDISHKARVTVTLEQSKSVSVAVIEGCSIQSIKMEACEKLKLESSNYRICVLDNGNPLNESLTWSEAGLVDGAELVLKKVVQLPRPNMVGLSKFKDMILPKNSSESGTLIRQRRVRIDIQRSPGICGLQNIGNTCYINAALQCLFHASEFVEFFLSDEKPWRNTRDDEVHPFVITFANLVRDYWSGTSSVIAPRDLKAAISRQSARFSGYGEQDSHEFIMFLLECLHNDLNTANYAGESPNVRGNGTDDEEVAQKSLQILRSRDNSRITDLFQGLLKTKVTCPLCNSCVTMFEPYQTLSLPLPCNTTSKKPLFVFVPYDPLKPKRQMQARLGVDCRHVACAEVSLKGTIKWLDRPRRVESTDSSLWVFEIPDPTKTYAVVSLNGPKRTYIDGPFLVETSGPDTTPAQMEELVLSYFDYLWAPEGRFDIRPFTNSINKLRDKFSSMKKKGNPNGPRLTVSIKGNPRHGFKCEETVPFIAKRHVHAKLNIAHTLHGFNWSRLQRGISEIITPSGEYNEISLNQCLSEFCSEVSLDNDNKWQCQSCHEFVCARKKCSIWSSPPILIIHLKRFEQSLTGNRKLETHVSFPNELHLQSDQVPSEYRLFAVDEHVGCINSGHYIARAYCASKDSWYRFSDSTFDTCSEQAAHSPNAYVLFYERIN